MFLWELLCLGKIALKRGEIKNDKIDQGEELLKSIVNEDILEIKDNEEKQD